MKVPAAAVAAVEVLVPAAGDVEREGPLIPAEPGVRGLFTEAEEEEMSDFLCGSVSVLTGDSYERSWKLWLEFLWTWAASKDAALAEVKDDLVKAKVVLLFVMHLHSVGCKREEKVTEVLSALRHVLTVRYRVDVAFLDLDLLKKAKRACRRSPAEVRDHQDVQEANAILPLCQEITEALRLKLWVESSWDDFDGILMKAMWIGVGLGVDQGARTSSLCKPDGKKAKDHGLRNSRVVFVFNDEAERKAGPAMKGVQRVDVAGVRVKLSTHKAGVDCSVGVQVGSLASSELVGDLVEWAVHWADQDLAAKDGYFLSFWRLSRGRLPRLTFKTVTSKELRGAIKSGCADFGLDTVHFSGKSMRKTMATNEELTGASEEDRNQRGRWSGKGSTAAKFYTLTRAVTRGKKGEGLSLSQVKGLAGAKV